MAQDFESVGVLVTDSETAILTSNSDDAIVGLRLTNILSTAITMNVYIDLAGAGTDYYICKNLSIPPASSVELIQGGAKMVMQNTDLIRAQASAATSCAIWVSYVDAISS